VDLTEVKSHWELGILVSNRLSQLHKLMFRIFPKVMNHRIAIVAELCLACPAIEFRIGKIAPLAAG